MKKAYFAAGCFWHVQKEFGEMKGVVYTEAGYIGKKSLFEKYRKVNYDLVSKGVGFVECVKVDYDEKKISFNDLLEIFWKIHDPTSLDKQGNDTGVQYRSMIFYNSIDEMNLAESSMLKARQELGKHIVTKIVDLKDYEFLRAEDYHQHYYI